MPPHHLVRYGQCIGTLEGTIEVNTPGPSGVVPLKHHVRCPHGDEHSTDRGCKCAIM